MAYSETSVSVERSKEAIRRILIKAGARGVQFSEDFDEHRINVKFAKQVNGHMRTVSVSLVVPAPEKPKRIRRNSRKSDADRWDQMERATYRALHWWLKSQFEAVDFGLLSFEDVFLSHFEWMIDGRTTTVGAMVLPHLSNGSNFLPAPREPEIIDAQYAET